MPAARRSLDFKRYDAPSDDAESDGNISRFYYLKVARDRHHIMGEGLRDLEKMNFAAEISVLSKCPGW